MRADAPYKSIADVIKAKEPPKCGSTGTASSDYILSKILEEAVGAKFNTVLGYAGGSEIDIAVEKGEVICRAHSLSAHFGREPFDSWHKRNFDRHLVQTARKRDANLADAPTLNELFDQYKAQPNSRRISQILLAAGEFGRPIMVTPGTPAERVKILREAFLKTMSDPEVIGRGEKRPHGYRDDDRRRTRDAGERNIRFSPRGHRARKENIVTIGIAEKIPRGAAPTEKRNGRTLGGDQGDRSKGRKVDFCVGANCVRPVATA